MGRAGRVRAVADFGWDMIARRTADLYAAVSRNTRMSRPPLSST
jgi:starch synthase